MSDPNNSSPFNALPPVIAALAIVIIGVEIIFYAGSTGLVGGQEAIGWRLMAVQKFAYSPDIFAWMWQSGNWPSEHLVRIFSYLFLHGNFTHALFGAVIVLALGKMVGEVFHPLAVLLVFFVSGAIGAVVYTAIWPEPVTLIGSYPGAYGFIGAFTFLLWIRLRVGGDNQMRAFSLIAMLLAIQLVFGALFGSNGDWIADLAGFGTGFAMSFFLVPGGWSRIRAMIRHD
ncbi:rhomboid family intramembrane serine protease [Cognatishimia maritima]|uniref:Membrane associated serine protease, rhomboid family n=1 Tax=Cognatishimia maritima TaxID=870908 RepID=A0A1M5RZF8_9RHOB|nr:rhomboid family intramembrane serine protease [Cognatishimia maritima]SHH31554.1 Membrane associated serine protease, rhomboid family [Cognatishimia maritima]